jgi:hypothetical protein
MNTGLITIHGRVKGVNSNIGCYLIVPCRLPILFVEAPHFWVVTTGNYRNCAREKLRLTIYSTVCAQ